MEETTRFDDIRDWAEARGLYEKGDVKTQFVKLSEEMGELAQGIIKNKPEEVNDAIGDMVVVLTNLAHLHGMEIEQCIEKAWSEIKDRKGSMKNGSFVKNDCIEKIYVTFGQQHTHRHNGITLDKDCVGVIRCQSKAEGRVLAVKWFGAKFATTYDKIDGKFIDFFPRGFIELN